jgi:hypothetical protein
LPYSIRNRYFKGKPNEKLSRKRIAPQLKNLGTGLGLTISNKLLELMESHLQLSSEIGIGSTFYFDLDLQTTDNEVETLLEIDKEDIVVDAFAFHSNDRLEALK